MSLSVLKSRARGICYPLNSAGGASTSSSLCSSRSDYPFRKETRRTISSTSARLATTALAAFKVPSAKNEPNQHYAPSSPERQALQSALKTFHSSTPLSIPLVINGQAVRPSGSSSASYLRPSVPPPGRRHHQTQIRTATLQTQRNPANHAQIVARYPNASPGDVRSAIETALVAKREWERLPFVDRASVFLKAAELVSTKYRYELMAATMVGQGKNAWQAEIDAAAECCDFWRFNVEYAEQLYAQQPVHNTAGVWNRVEYRPLEGFTYAVSPFNFTAIGANLPSAPALMGNVVLWKPSPFAIASNYLVLSILTEAGLPPGVIQFVPGDAEEVTKVVLGHEQFSALHYTGSTRVFRSLYGAIAEGIVDERYKAGYPRIVGETGGKNYHLVHPSAEIETTVYNTVRGAFEFQGQKCSACSRAYVPRSLWPDFKALLVSETEKLKIGPPDDFSNFIGPVIHEAAFKRLAKVIDDAETDPSLELITGGRYDSSRGYFIRPTIYATTDVTHPILSTELFGPILVVHVYDDTSSVDYFRTIIDTIQGTSGYGLTGSVFARDRQVLRFAEDRLRHSAGNYYINAKCTGAVVGQQPFGGARASGTNDKAGSISLLGRFVSMRAIKEEFVGPTGVTYPSNQ